jgi:PII-like signaling protein
MQTTTEARLRVYLGEDKRIGDTPLYRAIVRKAHELGMSGLTLMRGTHGFGHSTRMHTVDVLFSEDLPVIIEVIDLPEKIEAFSKVLETVSGVGLMTLDSVAVFRHSAQSAGG